LSRNKRVKPGIRGVPISEIYQKEWNSRQKCKGTNKLL